MRQRRLYYFSPETLSFTDARWAKVKTATVSLIAFLFFVVGGFELNQFLDDAVGLGLKRAEVLSVENAVLKRQLALFSARLAGLEEQLQALHESGNQLRLLVELPTIDDDTRKAGVGGTDDRLYLGGTQSVAAQLQSLSSLLTRAERETRLQRTSYAEALKAYEVNTDRFARLPAIKPMEGFLSSKFGMRLHPIFNIHRAHEGIDIVNVAGTPVHAAGDGEVVVAGRNLSGYGIMVMIDHGYGYTTVYGHLEKALVREGQKVKRGQLIGRCGKTGLATNTHLHYEVRLNGVQQNPIDYFFDDLDHQEYLKSRLALIGSESAP